MASLLASAAHGTGALPYRRPKLWQQPRAPSTEEVEDEIDAPRCKLPRLKLPLAAEESGQMWLFDASKMFPPVDTKVFRVAPPGGFGHGVPRRVFAAQAAGLGTAKSSDDNQHLLKDVTYGWPALINVGSNAVLSSTCPKMDDTACALRNIALDTLGDLRVEGLNHEDVTFDVCTGNLYTEKTHQIAAHKDDPPYYGGGLYVASFTYYPEAGKDGFTSFQVRLNDEWVDVHLPHCSLLIFRGTIKHRVTPKNKSERANWTFRSGRKDSSGLCLGLSIANLGRYYGVPRCITLAADSENTDKAVELFSAYCSKHDLPFAVRRDPRTKAQRKAAKDRWVDAHDAIKYSKTTVELVEALPAPRRRKGDELSSAATRVKLA